MSDHPIAKSPVEVGSEIPTSIVERYLARRSHANQMVFSLMCFWHGEMKVPQMREAWRRVLLANVRTHSTLAGRGHRTVWRVDRLDDDLERHLIVIGQRYDPTKSFDPDRLPEVRSGVGVNMLLWVAEDGHSVTQFQFHHACVDGVGASRLVGDTFKNYQAVLQTTQDQPSKPGSSQAKLSSGQKSDAPNGKTESGKTESGDSESGKQRAVIQRAVIQRAVIQRAVIQRAVKHRAARLLCRIYAIRSRLCGARISA